MKVERIRDVSLPAYATPGAAAFDLEVGAFLSAPDFAPTEIRPTSR